MVASFMVIAATAMMSLVTAEGAERVSAQTAPATAAEPALNGPGVDEAGAETQISLPAPAQPGAVPAAHPSAVQGFLARWLDLQNATLNLRYRFVDNSAGVVTTNQMQHRESLRARLKFDSSGRYALNFGLFTGVRFTSGWDNTGWGINSAQKNLAFKALYFAAQPIAGVETQVGGLYIIKGESTEFTTYDEDGFVTGERVSVRRPKQLFFDEISVTSAYFVGGTGPANIPVHKRLPHIDEQNYQHYLVDKKIGKRAGVSGDYTREGGRHTWRQAINLKVRESRVIDSVIVEAYQRTSATSGNGFAFTVDKALNKKLSVNGGYARIDPNYGPLNADRFNIGNRAFITTTYSFSPELLASFYITTAVGRNGVLPQRTLSNTVVTYNVIPALKRTGLF
jgi:hypothetical protein